MAARNFIGNRYYSWHAFPVQLEARVSIGSSGAPTLITSSTIPGTSSPAQTIGQSKGIKSITRLSTGRYQVQLDDNFSSMFQFNVNFEAPVSGSNIPVDATTAGLSVGTVYQITAVGTATTAANWVTLGLPAGMTAAVGMVFKAATTGTGTQSGAGTAKVIGANAACLTAEIIGDPDAMLNNQPFQQGSGGGYVNFQTVGPSFAGSALGTHTHDLIIIGGQAASTTNDVATYAGPILGKEQATNATILGANSATAGGVVAASAGTPAGTVSSVATDPTSGSIMIVRMLFSNSSIQ